VSFFDFLRRLFGGSSASTPVEEPIMAALPPGPPPPPPPKTPSLPPGEVSFVLVYEEAGMSAHQRELVSKAQSLLRELPPETPSAVKRNIVEAALLAFDVSTQEILVAAQAESDALKGFTEKTRQETEQRLAEERLHIADLEGQIAAARARMDQAVQEQATREKRLEEERDRVAPVLRFFLAEGGPKSFAPAAIPAPAAVAAPPTPAVTEEVDVVEEVAKPPPVPSRRVPTRITPS
jgi:hypothetical protein